jgi:hypothetical protein
MSRFYKNSLSAVVLVLAFGLGALAANKRLDNLWSVAESVENFRAEPNGAKLGTLLQGTEIEQIGEQGKWVRFRVEGWIWGPSLDGYKGQEDSADERGADEPISPLLDELPRLKKLVNDKYGVFYGIALDEDLQRLQLRLRVQDIGDEVLQLRLRAVQRGVFEILEGVVEFQVLRIETNRADGSGEVGARIVETTVADLVRYGDDQETWRMHTRFSKDGGETWAEVVE